MLTRNAKEKMLEEIAREFAEAELLIVTDFRGLNVHTLSNLRRRLRDGQCRYRVTKNTLNRLACRKAGLEELESFFDGPTAIAYSSGDPVSVAKIFLEYKKENEIFSIKGGMLAGKVLSADQIRALGEIPSREVLLSRVVGGFQAPISGLVGVLQGTLRKLVYTVDAVRQMKESA
ncbi:MAG TPA: 50S ribosomal protein L10 [Candidatus Limnocylindrales bacterium]|nr:50S ribosomal protein L10 [Candidatus Limnocylindrales bacterium]